MMGLVDVMDPVTEREDISTTSEKVEGLTAMMAPVMSALVEVRVPTEVTLLNVNIPVLLGT